MSAFGELEELQPLAIWDGVAARAVHGERLTFAVIELDQNAVVPEHRHDNEQVGALLTGSMTFTISGETRAVTSGATWAIPPGTPHDVVAGPEGAVVIEAFAPGRDDWARLEPGEPRPPRSP